MNNLIYILDNDRNYFDTIRKSPFTGKKLANQGMLPGYGVSFNIEDFDDAHALELITRYGAGVLPTFVGFTLDFPKEWIYFPKLNYFFSNEDLHSFKDYLKNVNNMPLNKREFNLMKSLTFCVNTNFLSLNLNPIYDNFFLDNPEGSEINFSSLRGEVEFKKLDSKLLVDLAAHKISLI